MITATELRIGNLVYFENKIYSIDTISKEFPTLDTIEFGIGVVTWGNLQGIPITEEWLLKFGAFHIEAWTWGFEIDDITTLSVTYAEGKYYWSLRQFDLKTEINMFHLMNENFLYVHQLQNIYFALTQKELETNGN
jgi:hypothetical protein